MAGGRQVAHRDGVQGSLAGVLDVQDGDSNVRVVAWGPPHRLW